MSNLVTISKHFMLLCKQTYMSQQADGKQEKYDAY